MIEWLPWLPSKSCYTNLKLFETLKDISNPSEGFRFVAFLILEILGVLFDPYPHPLVLGVGTKTLGARRVKVAVVYIEGDLSPYLGFFRVYLGFHLSLPYAAKIIKTYCSGIRANCSGVKIYYNPL